MVKILLANSCLRPWLFPTFKLAQELNLDGLEITPYYWTKPSYLLRLEKMYQKPLLGLHLPFFWDKESFQDLFQKRFD